MESPILAGQAPGDLVGKTPGHYDVLGSMEEQRPGAEDPPGSARPVGNGRVGDASDSKDREPVTETSADQMTVAGAAWQKLGDETVLVVLGRGPSGPGDQPATAALTVHHQGRSYR